MVAAKTLPALALVQRWVGYDRNPCSQCAAGDRVVWHLDLPADNEATLVLTNSHLRSGEADGFGPTLWAAEQPLAELELAVATFVARVRERQEIL